MEVTERKELKLLSEGRNTEKERIQLCNVSDVKVMRAGIK